MQYRFADLVDLPGFQQVMQSWYSVAGVPTALLDTERTILCAVGWQDICTMFHHLPPQAQGRCTHSDDYIFSNFSKSRGKKLVHSASAPTYGGCSVNELYLWGQNGHRTKVHPELLRRYDF